MVAVAAPSEDELAEAIERPARRVGVRFEPGLVSQIVADVRDQPGALPLLQYALTELFANRTSDVLTLEGYLATGGVVGALGRRAEELYAQLGPSARAACRQVFLRLVSVDPAAQTRGAECVAASSASSSSIPTRSTRCSRVTASTACSPSTASR